MQRRILITLGILGLIGALYVVATHGSKSDESSVEATLEAAPAVNDDDSADDDDSAPVKGSLAE